MKLLGKSLAASLLCAASSALAADHPYGAPATLAAPRAAMPAARWSQKTARRANPAPTPADGSVAPEAAPVPEGAYSHGAAPGAVIEGSGTYSNGGGAYGGAAYGDGAYGGSGAACDGSGAGAGAGYGAGYGAGAAYADGGASAYDDAMSYDEGAGLFGGYGGACGGRIWGRAAGLVMGRDHANCKYTSYQQSDRTNQIMCTQDASADAWRGGFEVALGASYQEWGISASFWMLDDFTGGSSVRSQINDIATPFDTGEVRLRGISATTFFDGAREHRIERRDKVHNVEINFMHLPMCYSASGFQLSGFAGARWFNFDERLSFCSVRGGSEFGANGGLDQAHLDSNVNNNLIGFQIGAELNWQPICGLRFHAIPKVGVYGNRIDGHFALYDGAGNFGTANPPAPGVVSNFPIDQSKTDVAMMGQIDIGASYDVNCHVRIFGGYRALAVSGLALSDAQIPAFLVDVPEWRDIDSNGHLILHGAYAGLEFSW